MANESLSAAKAAKNDEAVSKWTAPQKFFVQLLWCSPF